MSRRLGQQLHNWVSQPQAGATSAQPQGAGAGSAQPQAGAASQPQAGSAQPQVGAGSQQVAQHLAFLQRLGLQHLLRNRPASLLAAIATTTTIKAVNITIVRFIVLIPPLGNFWASPGITLPSPMRQCLLTFSPSMIPEHATRLRRRAAVAKQTFISATADSFLILMEALVALPLIGSQSRPQTLANMLSLRISKLRPTK